MARKSSIDSIVPKQGQSIDYPEALKGLYQFSNIYILSPTKSFKDYIFLFPNFSFEKIDNNQSISHTHKNFLYYKTKWYEPKDIFKNKNNSIKYNSISSPEDEYSVLFYYQYFLKGNAYYKFPCSYFDLTTPQQVEFKQSAIQPIRNLLGKLNLLTPDNRGKGVKEKREIRQRLQGVVIKAFKKARRKRPIPVAFIQSQITTELEKIFPEDPATCDKHVVSDNTIRRILKREGIV